MSQFPITVNSVEELLDLRLPEGTVLPHSGRTTHEHEEWKRVKLNFYLDWSGKRVRQALAEGNKSAWIKWQDKLRPLSLEEYLAFEGETITVAQTGLKLQTREDRIETMVATGIPKALAAKIVDNPEILKRLED
jgi:hypothetical protein